MSRRLMVRSRIRRRDSERKMSGALSDGHLDALVGDGCDFALEPRLLREVTADSTNELQLQYTRSAPGRLSTMDEALGRTAQRPLSMADVNGLYGLGIQRIWFPDETYRTVKVDSLYTCRQVLERVMRRPGWNPDDYCLLVETQDGRRFPKDDDDPALEILDADIRRVSVLLQADCAQLEDPQEASRRKLSQIGFSSTSASFANDVFVNPLFEVHARKLWAPSCPPISEDRGASLPSDTVETSIQALTPVVSPTLPFNQIPMTRSSSHNAGSPQPPADTEKHYTGLRQHRRMSSLAAPPALRGRQQAPVTKSRPSNPDMLRPAQSPPSESSPSVSPSHSPARQAEANVQTDYRSPRAQDEDVSSMLAAASQSIMNTAPISPEQPVVERILTAITIGTSRRGSKTNLLSSTHSHAVVDGFHTDSIWVYDRNVPRAPLSAMGTKGFYRKHNKTTRAPHFDISLPIITDDNQGDDDEKEDTVALDAMLRSFGIDAAAMPTRQTAMTIFDRGQTKGKAVGAELDDLGEYYEE